MNESQDLDGSQSEIVVTPDIEERIQSLLQMEEELKNHYFVQSKLKSDLHEEELQVPLKYPLLKSFTDNL